MEDRFDRLPPSAYEELKYAASQINDLLKKYYDPHTQIIIRSGQVIIQRDVINTWAER